MSDIPSGSKSKSASLLLGRIVGGTIGAAGRFLVDVLFWYYYENLGIAANTHVLRPGRPPRVGEVPFSDILFSVFTLQKGSAIVFISASVVHTQEESLAELVDQSLVPQSAVASLGCSAHSWLPGRLPRQSYFSPARLGPIWHAETR